MSFPGRINCYRCDDCGGVMVTIDKDVGDTTYFVPCQLKRTRQIDETTRVVGELCGGRSVSALYDVEQNRTAWFEWYRPVPGVSGPPPQGWYEQWKVANGMLLLRPKTSGR